MVRFQAHGILQALDHEEKHAQARAFEGCIEHRQANDGQQCKRVCPQRKVEEFLQR